MELLFICSDAQASSLVGALQMATESTKAGKPAGVLFTGEALLAMTDGVLLWPREFWPQKVRWGLADRAKAAGLPVSGRGQFRALDVPGLLNMAQETGVEFYACPVWAPLLGLEEKLPPYIKRLEIAHALKLLTEAKTVVGSF